MDFGTSYPLTATYHKNYIVEKYRQFINTFGTHYIKEANMGALYGQQSTISAQSWGRMVNQDLDISASAGYSGEIILIICIKNLSKKINNLCLQEYPVSMPP